jgi:hypothetical protein
MIYGDGAARGFDFSEATTLPTNGFVVGDFIRMQKYATGQVEFYVNGVKYYDKGLAAYWDSASSANSLDVQFGGGIEANVVQSSPSLNHGNWQGLIDRLWIANGVAVTGDDNGTAFPTGTTHSWLLNETTGATFAAASGGVNGQGVN